MIPCSVRLTALSVSALCLSWVFFGACGTPKDVKFLGAGNASGSGGDASVSGGSGGTSSGGTNSGGTGGGGATAGTAGDSGGGVRPDPSKGLVVIGGEDDNGEDILVVLDAQDGSELDRETITTDNVTIAELSYDGAPGRDVWFVFTAASYPADPEDTADLQVRWFDDQTNTWQILSDTSSLPPPVPGSVVVLNERVAYLSHVFNEEQMLIPSITVLNASDLTNVSRIASYVPDVPSNEELRIGLLATRGTAALPDSVGGTLNVLLQNPCETSGGPCNLSIQEINVTATAISDDQPPKLLGSFKGRPAWTSRLLSGKRENVVMMSPNDQDQLRFFGINPDDTDTVITTNVASLLLDIPGLTFAECENYPVFTSADTGEIGTANLATTLVKTAELGHEGQRVVYEPFTRAVITTFHPPPDTEMEPDAGMTEPAITAWAIPTGGQPDKRTEFSPPVDVFSNVVATRTVLPVSCP